MKCKGLTRSGKPCRSPEHMVAESGFCHAHGPAARERMADRGRKGALSLRRKVKGSGLTEDDLGALEAHEDAKRWLETIGRAVATGRLGDRAAQAAIKAVSEWVRTEGERVGAVEFEALRQDVEKLKDLYGTRATRLQRVATDRC